MKFNFRNNNVRKEVLDEAELILYEGGEIPEVRFWNSFFYLTSPPPEGLGLKLTEEELKTLKTAVLNRYILIIERDLTYEFIDKHFYRGIGRAVTNLKRLKNFLKNSGLEGEFKKRTFKTKITNMFKTLENKLKKNGKELSLVGTREEIEEFKKELKTL